MPKKSKPVKMKAVDLQEDKHALQHDVVKVVDDHKKVDEKEVFEKPKTKKKTKGIKNNFFIIFLLNYYCIINDDFKNVPEFICKAFIYNYLLFASSYIEIVSNMI